MKIQKFREGDLVKIPFPDGRCALVKVLYLGKFFKNVIAIGVCRWMSINECEVDIDKLVVRGTPLYTNVIAAKRSNWTILGNRPLTPAENLLTLRVLGYDSVYLKDVFVRDASTKDRKMLHKMFGIGMPTVYIWIDDILAGKPIGVWN